jgi:hypothetical protein
MYILALQIKKNHQFVQLVMKVILFFMNLQFDQANK